MDTNRVLNYLYRIGLGLLPLGCLISLLAIFVGSAGVAELFRNHSLQNIIAILANLGIGILMATMYQDKSTLGEGDSPMRRYWGALLATGTLLPGILMVITIIIYFVGWAETVKYTLFWGSAISVWLLFAAAFISRRFIDAKNAVPSSYDEFNKRFSQAKAAFQVLCPQAPDDPGNHLLRESPAIAAACQEVLCQIDQINQDLKRPGPEWVVATGYVNIWGRLYNIEEALFEIASEEKVLEWAFYDELRLDGSDIDISHRQDLLSKVRHATAVIRPDAIQYLKTCTPETKPLLITTISPLRDRHLQASGGTPPYTWEIEGGPPNGMQWDSGTGLLTGKPEKTTRIIVRVKDSTGHMKEQTFRLDPSEATNDPALPAEKTDPKTIARSVLRTVRRSLDEYRGAIWDGLILARNHLLATMFLTTLAAYALLVIALIFNTQKHTIFAASIFYLVGTTIGLASRLRTEFENKTGFYDYGLTAARLITIPIFSGLAAISGVVLIAMLPYASQVFGPLPSPSQPMATIAASQLAEGTADQAPGSGKPQGGRSSGSIPSLNKIFNLDTNLIGLLVAAAFGLTPGLVFDRLKALTDKYQADLKSSQSSQGKQQT